MKWCPESLQFYDTYHESLFCWDLGRTNSPTSVRHGDDLVFIRIWATTPIRLVFWDSAPSPYKWYQSHAPNLVVCVSISQGAAEGAVGPCQADSIKIEVSREVIMLQVLHVRRVVV